MVFNFVGEFFLLERIFANQVHPQNPQKLNSTK